MQSTTYKAEHVCGFFTGGCSKNKLLRLKSTVHCENMSLTLVHKINHKNGTSLTIYNEY